MKTIHLYINEKLKVNKDTLTNNEPEDITFEKFKEAFDKVNFSDIYFKEVYDYKVFKKRVKDNEFTRKHCNFVVGKIITSIYKAYNANIGRYFTIVTSNPRNTISVYNEETLVNILGQDVLNDLYEYLIDYMKKRHIV